MDIAVDSVPAAVDEVAGLVADADKAIATAFRAVARLQDKGVAAATKVGIPSAFIGDALMSAARVSSRLALAAVSMKDVHTVLHAAKAELSKRDPNDDGPQRAGGPWGKE